MPAVEPATPKAAISSGANTSGANTSQANASRAMQMLEEGIARITDSDSFRRYLAFTQAFHAYSANNMLLIFHQAPRARMVAGYQRWKELGRQVNRGEKAIKILAPIVRKVTDEETGERVPKVVGFKDCNVFDISQTSGESPPPQPAVGSPEGEAASARKLYDLLAGICCSEAVKITEKQLGPGHYGYYHLSEKKIVLSANLSSIEKATTLCHELCHHFLHPAHARVESATATKETEAEGASFAICNAFAIDTGAFSFPYIARHAKDPQLLTAVIGRIQQTVHRILDYAEAHSAQAANKETGTEAGRELNTGAGAKSGTEAAAMPAAG